MTFAVVGSFGFCIFDRFAEALIFAKDMTGIVTIVENSEMKKARC